MKAIVLTLLISGCRVVYPCNGAIVLVEPSEALSTIGFDTLKKGLHVWDSYGCQFRVEEELTDFEKGRIDGKVLPINDMYHTPADAWGLYDEFSGEIQIDSKLFSNANPDYAIHVTAHELGHALGLDHIPASAGAAIMNPIADISIKLTDLDYDSWCRIWCNKTVDPGGIHD